MIYLLVYLTRNDKKKSEKVMLLGANVVFPWFWNHLFFQVRLNLGYLLLYLHTIKNKKYCRIFQPVNQINIPKINTQ